MLSCMMDHQANEQTSNDQEIDCDVKARQISFMTIYYAKSIARIYVCTVHMSKRMHVMFTDGRIDNNRDDGIFIPFFIIH